MTGLVFAKLFFPNSDPLVGTLEAFGIYAVGFIARPIGAAIFGHYGDRIGRKSTLIATLMIMGVALWMFPRPEKGDVRYDPRVAGAAYWAVTLGTAGRVAGELLRQSAAASWLRWAIVGCGLAQALGLVAFFYTMWPRIRGVGSPTREARGERF